MPHQLNIDWKVESIRITGFVATPPKTRALEEWLESTSQVTPMHLSKTADTFSGLSRAEEGFVRLDCANGRMDTLVTPIDPAVENSIGRFAESQELFRRYLGGFSSMAELPLLDRIAFGLILTNHIDDEATGLDRLSRAITGIRLDPRVRDFQYRENIPVISHIVDCLLINRLTTWSVGQVQTIQVLFGTDGSRSQETIALSPIAMRLELDMNTDKNVQIQADADTSGLLLSEMQTLASDIATYGDIAMVE